MIMSSQIIFNGEGSIPPWKKKPQPITVAEYRDYCQRKQIDLGDMTDDELQFVLDKGNRIEREHNEARQGRRELSELLAEIERKGLPE